MDNKKYKTMIGTIVGLTTVAGAMFGYQNFYLENKQKNDQTVIYVANQDIQAKTKIQADMFEARTVSTGSVLDSYITGDKLQEVLDKELKGGLLKGEPLTSVRLNKENEDLSNNLVLKLEPDYKSEVKTNDNVKVYVMLTDKISGEVSMKQLFASEKKLLEPEVNTNNAVTTTDTSETQVLLIKVTDEELRDYYKAKATGKIIVSKVSDLDLQDIVSDKDLEHTEIEKNEDVFDVDSEEVQNSYRATDNKDNSIAVMSYTVQEGDTIDTLSLKFKTSAHQIQMLNDNKDSFVVGDVITVPAI